MPTIEPLTLGHFAHEIESPWPIRLMVKVEPVQVLFTLRLRDQRSKWIPDGCEVYMDSYMASNGLCFMVTWIIFQKPPSGDRPSTKSRDNGTPNAHNRWFILSYLVWKPAWIEIHWISIWLKYRSHMASHYSRGSVTTLHTFGGFLRRPLDTFFWALIISQSRLLAHVWIGPYRSSLYIMWYQGDFAINFLSWGGGT